MNSVHGLDWSTGLRRSTGVTIKELMGRQRRHRHFVSSAYSQRRRSNAIRHGTEICTNEANCSLDYKLSIYRPELLRQHNTNAAIFSIYLRTFSSVSRPLLIKMHRAVPLRWYLPPISFFGLGVTQFGTLNFRFDQMYVHCTYLFVFVFLFTPMPSPLHCCKVS